MVLVAVLVVVVVVIVAAVLLMGGGGQQAPPGYPGTAPQGTAPPASSGESPQPTAGASGGETNIDINIANAMADGTPVECEMTGDLGKMSGDPSAEGMMMTASMKVEAPKMYMEGTSMGQSFKMISDGAMVYIYSAGQWYEFPMGEEMDMAPVSPEEVQEMIDDIPEGVSINCQVVGDIPDSMFQLPAGASPVDLSEMMGEFDPSMYEGMY